MIKGMINMRKKVITLILIAIMVQSVYACGRIMPEEANHDGINESVQGKEVSEETEDTLSNSEVQQAADEESTDPIYIIEPELTQDDTYEMQDWQAAYIEYIEDFERKGSCDYSLIYVDEDDIPELVIDTGSAAGCHILTFHNGVTDVLETWRIGFTYVEKGNLLNNSSGNMGHYYDRIHSIVNGKWVYVTGGEWQLTMGEDDQERRYYEWEGEPVEEEVYEEKIAEVYDGEQAIEPEQYERLDEMLFRLQMGTALSRTHRYELYVEDVTWDEAQRRCEEKGGYLATITTAEEYECIKNGIEDSGQTQIAYWVGAYDDNLLIKGGATYEWYEPNWDSRKYFFISNTIMGKYWADGEPSYFKQAADKQIDELGIYLLYDDAKEDCYLYDAPMDMLLRNPEYTGKIGYICEYDSVTVMAKENLFYPIDGGVYGWHEYEYDSTGNLTKDISYNDEGDIGEWSEYEYDNAGKLMKEIRRSGADGKIYWYEYEYDSAGNQTKQTNSKGVVCWEKEYDSAGNETKWIEYRYDGSVWKRTEYEYDSAGNMIKDIAHEPHNDFEYMYEYEYDDAGNQTKEFYYTNGNIDYWVEYEYDDKGRQTGGTMYYASGSIWYIENEYDSRGKKTKIKITSSNDTEWAWEFEWEYDNMGNLTKYMEYRQGEIYIWREYEYISITPRNEATVSN